MFLDLLGYVTRERIITASLACISIGALFLVWYLGTKYKFEFYIRFKNVPTPYEVYQQLTQVGLSNKYLVNIAISVRRILLGFMIATLIGVPLGLAIGKYQRVRDFFMPVIEILRPIPAIAWVPMSIMLWPNNEASIVFITFIGAFFPILLNTIHGVHSLDGVLLRAARCLGASEVRLFWNVILPGSLPHIFTGLAGRHGRGLGLADRRGDDLRPVRRRLLHLGSLFAGGLSRDRARHDHDRRPWTGLQRHHPDGRRPPDALARIRTRRQAIDERLQTESTRASSTFATWA